jgi:hypothetical protein
MSQFSQFAVTETASLHLKDATGNLMFRPGPVGEDGKPQQLPVKISVYGPGTRQHAQAKAKNATNSFRRLRKKGNVEISADEQNAERAEFLCAITAGFENVELEGKSESEFATALYTDRKLGFIAEQVEEFQQDWENFSPRSEKS